MSIFKASDHFKKKFVVMKKGIPVFTGKAATGRIDGSHFSIVCPDEESCEFVWNLLMSIPLDRDRVQNVVLCREADVEIDVTPAKLKMVKS